jgi:hypothetical protein
MSQEKHMLALLITYLRQNSTLSQPMSVPKSDVFTAHLGRAEDVIECVANITGSDYHTVKDICNQHSVGTEQVLVDKIYLEGLLAQSKNQPLRKAVSKQTGIPLGKQNIPKFDVGDIVKSDKSDMSHMILSVPDPKQKRVCEEPFYEYQDNIGNDPTIHKCSQRKMEDGRFFTSH